MTDHELLLTGLGALPFRFDDPQGGEDDLAIPPRVHFVWIGSTVPAKYLENVFEFERHNPGWQVNLWVDRLVQLHGLRFAHDVGPVLARMRNRDLFAAETSMAAKADLLRYELIYQQGGVYLDIDTLSLGPGSLNLMTHAFLTVSGPPWFNTNNAQFGFAKGSEFLAYVIEHARDPRVRAFGGDGCIPKRTGPTFFTTCALSFGDTRIIHPSGHDLIAKIHHLGEKNW